MKLRSKLFAALALCFVSSSPAQAWEAETTHAGLTEQSALTSSLHTRLQYAFGMDKGVYSSLTVPKGDASELFSLFEKLNPTHGYTPDSRGKMSALAWLVAGSVLADMPASSASQHFFDPRNKQGLTNAGTSLKRKLYLSMVTAGSGSELKTGGEAAVLWWASKDNPMGYTGFADQFRKAVASSSAQARSRHLAGALLASGAMLHVLQDMGSPSHVRNDLAAHQEKVGTEASDRGSRFERIAALAFGRLGISRSAKVPALASLNAHFTNSQSTGLADVVEQSFFSSHTLPKRISIRRDAGSRQFRSAIDSHLRRPKPSANARLDLIAARNKSGATWTNESGVCLARYKHAQSEITWWIDDDCALEQLEAILPVVAGYGASFLKSLFPDDISLSLNSGKLLVTGEASHYGVGTLRFYTDSAQGERSEFFAIERSGDSSALASATIPTTAFARVTVLFDGKDKSGNPLLATATMSWPPTQ